MEAARREIKEYFDEFAQCFRVVEKYFDPTDPQHLRNRGAMTTADRTLLCKLPNLLDRFMCIVTLAEASGLQEGDPVFKEFVAIQKDAEKLMSLYVLPESPKTIEECREFVRKVKKGEVEMKRK